MRLSYTTPARPDVLTAPPSSYENRGQRQFVRRARACEDSTTDLARTQLQGSWVAANAAAAAFSLTFGVGGSSHRQAGRTAQSWKSWPGPNVNTKIAGAREAVN